MGGAIVEPAFPARRWDANGDEASDGARNVAPGRRWEGAPLVVQVCLSVCMSLSLSVSPCFVQASHHATPHARRRASSSGLIIDLHAGMQRYVQRGATVVTSF